MRKTRLKTPRGFFVTGAVMLLTVFTILLVSLIHLIQTNSRQTTYLNGKDAAYNLAEIGLSAAVSKLAYDSDLANFNTGPVADPQGAGSYQNQVAVRTQPVNPVYYIITSATKTIGGHDYSVRLHSYVRVSNVGTYFAATQDALTISAGANLAQAKVYSPTLTFVTGASPTLLQAAQYFTSCTPPTPWDSVPGLKLQVVISNSPNNEPEKLSAPLVFPQILNSDVAQYLALAGPHTVTSTFTGEIYPPGYADYAGNSTGDVYTGHTTDNHQHVYFYNGDMHIQGRVHGQVLFVATGNIHLTSNLISANPADPFPGASTTDGASTAHQAVLITTNSVIIDPTLSSGATEYIQALVLAPNGSILAAPYSNNSIPNTLSLAFTGSLIVSTLQTNASLPSVFVLSRAYSYMNTLRTNPPPYLPAIIEKYYSLEDK